MVSKKKIMLSLFSGAGGLDLGLSKAGFINKLCVEIDEIARKTLLINNPKCRLSSDGDIHKNSPKDLLSQAGLDTYELSLLAGGPPCQPFSKSGYWVHGDSARLKDPRSATLKAYLNIVREALPEVVLLENVAGIAYSQKDEGVRLLFDGLNSINNDKKVNYRPVVVSLDAVHFGVPQSRKRVFIIAQMEGKQFLLPEPTHSLEPNKNVSPVLTAWDAIGDLDDDFVSEDLALSGKWADLLPSIPEGNNYLWHTERMGGEPLFGWRTRYWSFLLKLAKDKPSWTIQAQPGPATGPFHWKNRLLSSREMARLQTFPDDYSFCGDRRAIQMQLGNAVPPAIGELLGLEIRRQFFGERVRKKLKLIPEKRNDCPPPEKPKAVPKKYLPLIGTHNAHPGTGKGPGAQKREQKEQANA